MSNNNKKCNKSTSRNNSYSNDRYRTRNLLNKADEQLSAAEKLLGDVQQRSSNAKQNYTAIRYGNDHGSISFGHIHKQGDVTAAVMLQTSDGSHQFSMDKDGQRKGWTTLTAPGNIQIEAGSANQEAQDTLMINAKNGNITIKANNGKLRLEGTDIELIAVGGGGDKGNIRMTATENITTDSKKLLMNASISYKIATSGNGEVIANSILTIYGSIFKGVDASCSIKDKGGMQRIDKKNNKT
jgi:hypothetical protein